MVYCCQILARLTAYGNYRKGQVPSLSFQKALAYTTEDNPEAVITMGVLRDGAASYTMYGENGRELPRELRRPGYQGVGRGADDPGRDY